MKGTGKSTKYSVKSDERNDRKSATGMSGTPKKGGHGGKYTWAGDGYSQAEIEFEKGAMDSKDPNFEDPEETETKTETATETETKTNTETETKTKTA